MLGSGAVEQLLAVALERASAAERWDIVEQLAGELEARRLLAADTAAGAGMSASSTTAS
jgi:hypothetical protein